MKKLYIIILIFSICVSFAQSTCDCTKSIFIQSSQVKPDSTFVFMNGKSIGACGFKEKVNGKVQFSEFVLQRCENNNELGFWDATKTCNVSMVADTLKVITIYNLPTGANRTYHETEWLIEKIFYKEETLNHQIQLNPKIRKYSKKEIDQTLSEYKKATGKMDDYKMEIANRLLIAIISGSNKAEYYLEEFEHKFGTLDGAFAEEYKKLKEMWSDFDFTKL